MRAFAVVSETEATIRRLTSATFEDVLARTPATDQDPYGRDAHRLVRATSLGYQRVVRMQGRDLTAGALDALRACVRVSNVGETEKLMQRLKTLSASVQPAERVFDAHKPPAKAAWDLARSLQIGLARYAEPAPPREPRGVMPGFVVLGAPRSATDWLHACLVAHPEVYVPCKELEFFGSSRYHLGLPWYASHFAGRTTEPVVGEVSVGYFASPSAPVQIAEALGRERVKLIVLLREPVDRALSYFAYRQQTGNAPRSFEASLKMRYFRNLYIDTGHYYRYWERYLLHFRSDQLLCLLFDDIRRDPLGAAATVARFLELNRPVEPSVASTRFNASVELKSLALHQLLYRTGLLFRLHWPDERGGARIEKWIRGFGLRHNRRPRRSSVAIDPRVRRRLLDEFAPSNVRLGQLLGRDLSAWSQ